MGRRTKSRKRKSDEEIACIRSSEDILRSRLENTYRDVTRLSSGLEASQRFDLLLKKEWPEVSRLAQGAAKASTEALTQLMAADIPLVRQIEDLKARLEVVRDARRHRINPPPVSVRPEAIPDDWPNAESMRLLMDLDAAHRTLALRTDSSEPQLCHTAQEAALNCLEVAHQLADCANRFQQNAKAMLRAGVAPKQDELRALLTMMEQHTSRLLAMAEQHRDEALSASDRYLRNVAQRDELLRTLQGLEV